MIAYYIQWVYPPSADNALFYGGRADDKLFHHKVNAIAYAKNYLKDILDKQNKATVIYDKIYNNNEELTDEENELSRYLFGDYPCDYIVKKRDIIFEDEE